MYYRSCGIFFFFPLFWTPTAFCQCAVGCGDDKLQNVALMSLTVSSAVESWTVRGCESIFVTRLCYLYS